MLEHHGLTVEQELDLAEYLCRSALTCSCGEPKKSIKALEGKHYYVCVYCPECKKAKTHSNDPEMRTKLDDQKKKEAVMCANT